MATLVSGYIVLRKPEFNFDELGRGAYSPYPPRIGDQFYGGVDRMQWFELDEDYYNQSLPNTLIELRKRTFSVDQQSSDVKLLHTLDDAKEVLAHANSTTCQNELVAVVAEQSSNLSGNNDSMSIGDALGCDIYCDGYGSLIREGVFSKPDLFEGYIDKLNLNGLFDCGDDVISQYIAHYHLKSLENEVEKPEGPVKKVQLFRINL